MRRVFADSSMLIAAAGSRSGASRAVLLLAEVGLFQLVVSRQVLDECERNLRRKLPAALPVFAELLAAAQVEVVPDPDETVIVTYREVIAAKDAPILAAAVLSRADHLLTLDSADFTATVAERAGLVIQTPGAFVTALRDLFDTAR
jgi:predicted nucleic acid-binding protein